MNPEINLEVNQIKSETEIRLKLSEVILGNLTNKFSKLFSRKLGCMKDVEIKLDIDSSVRPKRQPQRHVPFHLRNAVEKVILKQADKGMLEWVDDTTEAYSILPTLQIPWKNLKYVQQALMN